MKGMAGDMAKDAMSMAKKHGGSVKLKLKVKLPKSGKSMKKG